MKTIEERADEYADKSWREIKDFNEDHVTFENIATEAYSAGARSEHEELTKWHDPKEELPDTNRDVLIKTTSLAEYRIAFYKADGQRNYHWHQNNGAIDDDMVIGWREIHE